MKNVCIVGYGAIGPIHAKALIETENVKFYAVCDNNPERIEKCRKDYDVKAYLDFDEMLSDVEIDCVHICTPHYLHF
ncbi:MAG: Gfo/Idh/MocA family oxidoreductase [Clostridia bacterium]|nr:Gfo/Idh/MocA family oxidoreductase [Clostridia bacterium]